MKMSKMPHNAKRLRRSFLHFPDVMIRSLLTLSMVGVGLRMDLLFAVSKKEGVGLGGT